jgi:hypothetical protein
MQKNKFKSFSRFITHFVLIVCVLSFLNIDVAAYRPLYDFTGDGRTDFTTLGSTGGVGAPFTWKILRNPGISGPGNAFIRNFVFGFNNDTIVAGDFYGDSKTEIAVRRSSENMYYETLFPETSVAPVVYESWGQAGDNFGRDGDYDGDGKDDETAVRIVANRLNWWYKGTTSGSRTITFGATATGFSTFAFQGADFTGDGRDEFVICQVANVGTAARWYIGDSVTGAQILEVNWGNFNDDYLINPDDYTGDGIADIVIWRGATTTRSDAGYWFIRNTATGALVPPVKFGLEGAGTGDVPIRGNYDGDQKADIAVFRPSTRQWFWINSSDGSLGIQQWGDADDLALPGLFTF